MSRHLLIDGGQGACRAVYVEDGERAGEGSAVGLSRQAGDRTRGLLHAIEQVFSGIGALPDAVDVVVAGLTGFDDSPRTARDVTDGLRSLMRAGRVVVTNDAVTSYLGAVGPQPGAIVAAGTGAIALAGDTDGRFARSDGWGFILGDDGGGYYVGRRGLAGALRAYDGRGGSKALKMRAEEMFGPAEEIKGFVYEASNPASEVARFAPEVAEAARQGDRLAGEIWADAAIEVATTVTASLRQVFGPEAPVTVSWTGSLFEARDLLLEPFERHVKKAWPSARLLAPEGTALDGAELLARLPQPTMFGPLIHVSGV